MKLSFLKEKISNKSYFKKEEITLELINSLILYVILFEYNPNVYLFIEKIHREITTNTGKMRKKIDTNIVNKYITSIRNLEKNIFKQEKIELKNIYDTGKSYENLKITLKKFLYKDDYINSIILINNIFSYMIIHGKKFKGDLVHNNVDMKKLFYDIWILFFNKIDKNKNINLKLIISSFKYCVDIIIENIDEKLLYIIVIYMLKIIFD